MSEFERRDRRGAGATPIYSPPLQRLQQQAEPQGPRKRPEVAPVRHALTPALARSGVSAQRRAVSPTLQAAQLSRGDALAARRSGAVLAVQRQALQQAKTLLDHNGLTPQPLHLLERQKPAAEVSSAPLTPTDHQERTKAAQQGGVALLNRDAGALPFHKRAELVAHAIEAARKVGLDAEALRQHVLVTVSGEMNRETLQGIFLRQDTGRLLVSQASEDHGLLLKHAQLQRAVGEAQQEHDGLTQGTALERVQARRGQGQPLPDDVRQQLELGLNHDLSGVRIHSDDEADRIARSLHAAAFTSGKDIYFQSGEYNTVDKLELLAHEVTHVKQQDQGKVAPGIDPDASLETEAQQFGEEFVLGGSSAVSPKVRQGRKRAGHHPDGQAEPGQRLAVQRRSTATSGTASHSKATPEPKATSTKTGSTPTPKTSALPKTSSSAAPKATPKTPTVSKASPGAPTSGPYPRTAPGQSSGKSQAGTVAASAATGNKATPPSPGSTARTKALDANYLIRSDGNSSVTPRPQAPNPKADLHVLLSSLPGVDAKTLNKLTADLKAQLNAGTLKPADVKRLAQQAYTLQHYGVGSGTDILASVQGLRGKKADGTAAPTARQRVNSALNFDVGDWAVKKVDGAGVKWATAHGNTDLADFFKTDLQTSAHLKEVGVGGALLEAARAVPGQLQGQNGKYTLGSVTTGAGNLVGLGDVKGLITGTDFKGQKVNPYKAGFNLGLMAATGGAGRGVSAAGRSIQAGLTQTGEDLLARARYNAALLAWKTGLNDPQLAFPGAGNVRPPPNRADFMTQHPSPASGTPARGVATVAPKPLSPELLAADALKGQARQTALARLLPDWNLASSSIGKPATAATLPPDYLYAKIPLSSGKFDIRGYMPQSRPGEVPSLKMAPDGTWQPTGLSINKATARVESEYRLAQASEYAKTNPQPRLPGVKAATNNHHMTPDNVMRDSPLFQVAFAKGAVSPDRASGMLTLATSPENLTALRARGTALSDITHNTQHPKTDTLLTEELNDYVRDLQAEQKLPLNLKTATPQQLKEAIEGWDKAMRDRFMNKPDSFPRRSDGTLAGNPKSDEKATA